jgi:hypothetical protein
MLRIRRNPFLALCALLLGASGSLTAQETGTPVFKAPYRAFENWELGASLSDPKGASYAIEGFYSFGSGPNDVGIRGGYVDQGPQGAVALGIDFRRRIIRASESFPLDGALTAGFGTQLASGAYDAFFIPVGISLGRRIDLENSKTSFVPYFQPIIVPTLYSGDNAPDGGVDFALGLGVDIKFGGRLDIRVSGGIGDIDGVAVGLAYVH